MSVLLMGFCYNATFGSNARKAVAMALADHAWDDGTHIFPSNSRLCAKTELGERTVRRSLRELEECGFLVVVDPGGKGPRDTAEWTIDLEILRGLADGLCTIADNAAVQQDDPENKGATNVPLAILWGPQRPLRGPQRPFKGATVAPEPSLNRKEPSAQASAREGAPAFAPQQKGKKGLGREEHPPATTTASTWIKPGTPQWTAWLAHEQARTKTEWPVMRGKDRWLVPSMFPPVEKVRT